MDNQQKIKNCLKNQIIKATHYKLKAIIMQSILNLVENGMTVITARLVQEECLKNIQFPIKGKSRVPAICRAMRNLTEKYARRNLPSCGAIIIGEDRDFMDFTIKIPN